MARLALDLQGRFQSDPLPNSFARFLQDQLGELGLSIGGVGSETSKTRIFKPLESASFLGMEISWRIGSGYQLRISEKCIQKIGTKFADAGDIDKLLGRQITLPNVGKLLDEMERGYLQAYEAAENHGELVREVRTMKNAALETALEDTFGEGIYRLDKKRRRFLGIDGLKWKGRSRTRN